MRVKAYCSAMQPHTQRHHTHMTNTVLTSSTGCGTHNNKGLLTQPGLCTNVHLPKPQLTESVGRVLLKLWPVGRVMPVLPTLTCSELSESRMHTLSSDTECMCSRLVMSAFNSASGTTWPRLARSQLAGGMNTDSRGLASAMRALSLS